MAAPYLTIGAAYSRLSSSFNLDASGLSTALLSIASDEIDLKGPFLGTRYSSTQARAFPRSDVPDGETVDNTVPDVVLDYVALRAYQLSAEPEAAIKSRGVAGLSVSYAEPKIGRTEALLRGVLKALRRHQVKTGGLKSVPIARG